MRLYFHLNVKENLHAAKCGVLVEKQEDFTLKVVVHSLKTLSRDGWCGTKNRNLWRPRRKVLNVFVLLRVALLEPEATLSA